MVENSGPQPVADFVSWFNGGGYRSDWIHDPHHADWPGIAAAATWVPATTADADDYAAVSVAAGCGELDYGPDGYMHDLWGV